jgi:hypothetical protein
MSQMTGTYQVIGYTFSHPKLGKGRLALFHVSTEKADAFPFPWRFMLWKDGMPYPLRLTLADTRDAGVLDVDSLMFFVRSDALLFLSRLRDGIASTGGSCGKDPSAAPFLPCIVTSGEARTIIDEAAGGEVVGVLKHDRLHVFIHLSRARRVDEFGNTQVLIASVQPYDAPTHAYLSRAPVFVSDADAFPRQMNGYWQTLLSHGYVKIRAPGEPVEQPSLVVTPRLAGRFG